jgi:hypothetical protein
MSVYPKNNVEQIEFCEQHLPIWQSAPTTIGLTAAQCTAFENVTKSAREAYDTALAKRDAAKAATTGSNASINAMRLVATDLIRQIKAFAALKPTPTDRAAVYAAAQIPEPASPSPQPAPGIASDISVSLESSGAVTLTWSATDAAASSGAFYNVFRKLPGQMSFSQIGGAPGTTAQSRRMSFTDFTVPTSAAANGAQYIIQGRRGALVGESSEAITVQFGVDAGGGGAFTINGATAPMKIAA